MKQAVFGAGPFHEMGSESSHKEAWFDAGEYAAKVAMQEAKRGEENRYR